MLFRRNLLAFISVLTCKIWNSSPFGDIFVEHLRDYFCFTWLLLMISEWPWKGSVCWWYDATDDVDTSQMQFLHLIAHDAMSTDAAEVVHSWDWEWSNIIADSVWQVVFSFTLHAQLVDNMHSLPTFWIWWLSHTDMRHGLRSSTAVANLITAVHVRCLAVVSKDTADSITSAPHYQLIASNNK